MLPDLGGTDPPGQGHKGKAWRPQGVTGYRGKQTTLPKSFQSKSQRVIRGKTDRAQIQKSKNNKNKKNPQSQITKN